MLGSRRLQHVRDAAKLKGENWQNADLADGECLRQADLEWIVARVDELRAVAESVAGAAPVTAEMRLAAQLALDNLEI